MARVAVWEDPELTCSCGCSKIASYRATVYKKDVKTSRKDFPQLKI